MKEKFKILLCLILSILSVMALGNTKTVNAETAVRNDANWIDNNPNLGDYAYSFAVIGDTQNLCRDYNMDGTPDLKYANQYHQLYDWIIANKDSKKIKHVFGLGDITETHQWDWVDLEEWALAKEVISKMDGVISYSLVRGNHDMAKYLNQTFNYPAYTNQFDGFYIEGDLSATYKTMTIGVTDYLFITLNFGASDEELEWAGSVIEEHINHKVIITTHGYLNNVGYLNTTAQLLQNEMAYFNDIDRDVKRNYNNGEQIWEKLISKYGNIQLVMSGHIPSDNVLKREAYGVHGNKVIELLIDPQWMDIGDPVGMVCMLYFNEDGSEMDIEWYSTAKNKYYNISNQRKVHLENNDYPAHNYEYFYDEDFHWQECECEAYTDIIEHEWITNDNGLQECFCGATKTVKAKTDNGCNGSIIPSFIGIISLCATALFIRKKFK